MSSERIERALMVALAALWIGSCSSTNDRLDWLTADHQSIIAEDLAAALAMRHPPTEEEVFVADMPVRDRFESALRERGFAVTSDEDALRISGAAQRVPPNTWHVGLSLGEDVQLHRLYAIERDRVEARSAVSYGNAPKVLQRKARRWMPRIRGRDDAQDAESMESEWSLSELPKRQEKRNAVAQSLDPAAREFVEAEDVEISRSSADSLPTLDGIVRAEPQSANARSCDRLNLERNSLRESLEEMLKACGIRLAAWPDVDGRPDWTTDWLIDESLTFTRTDGTLSDLLDSLHASLGLRSRIDWERREARFSLDDS